MTRSPAGPIESPVRPGETFAGKYVVEKVIGTGGMGVVLAAHHPQLGQTVAIKLLITPLIGKQGIAQRFLREARAAAQLRNQHVARVMDAGTDSVGRQYIVMEYLHGHDLRAFYRREGLGDVKNTVGYILHACEALAEAHAAGIIHRDLKPENLFRTLGTDGSPLIKVLDFGISKSLHLQQSALATDPNYQVITTDQDILGSPAYMSPEQLRSPESVDARTDVWALGVILYELLTGRRPFAPVALADLIAEVLSLSPPPLHTLRDEVPEPLSAVVLKCLSKKASNRYQNVGELAQALRPWAPRWARESSLRAARTAGVVPKSSGKHDPAESADMPTAAPPEPAPTSAPTPARTPVLRWIAVGTVGAGMIAAVVFLALARNKPPLPPAVPSFERAQNTSIAAPPAVAEPEPATPPAIVSPPPPVEPAPAAAVAPPAADEALPPAAAPTEAATAPASGDALAPVRSARPATRRPGATKVRPTADRPARPSGRLGAAGLDPLEGRR